MTLENIDYSISPLRRSRIVSDSLIIPQGLDSSPGHEIYISDRPLTSSIYIYMCVYIYIYIYIYIYVCVCVCVCVCV